MSRPAEERRGFEEARAPGLVGLSPAALLTAARAARRLEEQLAKGPGKERPIGTGRLRKSLSPMAGGTESFVAGPEGDGLDGLWPRPSRSSTPVLAWRTWAVRRFVPDGVRLVSVQGAAVWPPCERLEASCRAAGWRAAVSGATFRPHSSPHPGCSCGIYGLSSRVQVPLAPSGDVVVAGRVSLWGRVVEHERGWRGQYAYPTSLFVIAPDGDGDSLVDELALAYGVPCEVLRFRPLSAGCGTPVAR